MRSWNIKEANLALHWASTPEEHRRSLTELAEQIGRSPKAILNFLRRQLPPGQRPWAEKPRWRNEEATAIVENSVSAKGPVQRSRAAVRMYKQRHLRIDFEAMETEDEGYSVAEVARAIGRSRRTVYRLIARGYLRRWKGGVSEASFERLVREYPEIIPYARLSRDHREWLVLNGFPDPTMKLKAPSTKGLFPKDKATKSGN
jgi:IS30 family transposase